MNKILNLFDEQYVLDLFGKKVLPLYPDFTKIKKIKILPHKKLVWSSTYHVAIQFKTEFLGRDRKIKTLPIYCTAHSSEPRKNVFDGLTYLWQKGFGSGYLTVPHPLFYDEYYNGTFYRGVSGNNLYFYLKENNFKIIENIIPKVAHWFVKLHSLSVKNAWNFNKENSRIATVFPGIDHIYQRIEENCPHYLRVFRIIHEFLISAENEFLGSTDRRWLVHGDAHPENVIKVSENKIALIDFTDLCLADFARDLGSFTQQLDYMSGRKIEDEGYSEKIKRLFLNCYFAKSKIKLDDDLKKRIANYYNWTAMRTAAYFLLKTDPEPDRAAPLILKTCQHLSVKYWNLTQK